MNTYKPSPLCINAILVVAQPQSGVFNAGQNSIGNGWQKAQPIVINGTRANGPTFDKILGSYTQHVSALIDARDGRPRKPMLWMRTMNAAEKDIGICENPHYHSSSRV
jgi:hypothetical protein